MKKIIVNGGKNLSGDISVSGSKNAALPIIFACILTRGVSCIENMPDIGDVSVALALVGNLGARVERRGSTVSIDTTNLSYSAPDPRLVSEIRASTYLMGACLGRFGGCHITAFGGCNFSHRPIDMHIDAARSLGAAQNEGMLLCDRLTGAEIAFDKASVGATVNAILLAATAEGSTHISGCAVEPHIDSLIAFLNSCGAEITRRNREIYIVGRELHGGKISIIGDMIEAGSYLALSLMCESKISLKNAPTADMSSFFEAMEDLGARISFSDTDLSMSIGDGRFFSVRAEPYPGFPTDLAPIVAPLMARFSGGRITDTVWPTRFGYLEALSSFGVNYSSEHGAATIRPSTLHSGVSSAPDLRGGMACLMTALATAGQSEIYSLDKILRGYEYLEMKLRALGADIKIIDT